jgi:Protein of unknown function (DUF1553)/Protein of unknown function (DUF1549)/Planctomycete cytochrome C
MRLIAILCFLTVSLTVQAAERVDFNRDVRPILSENCFRCHGPDEKQRKAKLRLDSRDGALAKVVVSNQPGKSEFVRRILAENNSERMPPADSGKKLSAAQIDVLKRWVEQGAEYKGHWAFVAPVRPEVPKVATEAWARGAIDRFILSRLEREGLNPSAEADPVTLIRRLTLDLTGQPPTIEEVDRYVREASAKPQVAYEKLVDRLLASPRYGERMALEWLDAARYADTHGYHIDSGRNMTRWREYVIDAFNNNKPFDQFTIEQLAGDLLPSASLEQKIASGFNRNHMINFEGGAIPDEYKNAYIVDRVNTTTTVWLGLTFNCAQCHDHKYDPFTMKDYYSFYAFFNNLPERGLDGNKGNAVPLLKVPTKEQAKQLRELRDAVAALDAKLKGPLPDVDAAQAEWEKGPIANKTTWKTLTLDKLRSKGGATLKVLDDKSILAEGTNPATETYTVSFVADLPRITAIRIEALADERFTAKGPGRSSNGNFVMTGVRVTTNDDVKPKATPIKAVSADFSQDNYPVTSLLGKGSGWGIYPQVGKDHWVVIELAEPIATPGKEVTIQLQFNSQSGQHQFGRFRLAATDSATPHASAGLPPAIESILSVPADKRTDVQKNDLRYYYRTSVSREVRSITQKSAELQREIAGIEAKVSDAMVMEEMPKPRETFMLVRGQYDKRGDKVTPNTPGALPALKNKGDANRLDLAKWLVRDDQPLMARVIVNRYWQMYFGTGLVKTSEDFGSQGEWPSHPELLDWLAVEFRESGWDVKRLQKLIVMSAAYQQSSTATKDLLAKDPENRLLARSSRLRLQAEFIRDQALAVSGLLNGEIGGASVSPYQPKGIWEELASRADGDNWTAQKYVQSHGKDLYRRTMYTFWKRTAPPPTLVTFDAPDREQCVVRRSRTNTPLQALILMNDPTYVEASRKLAERMMTEGGPTIEERITFAFRLCTARRPNDRETAILKGVYASQLEKFRADKAAAEKLLNVGESPRNDKLDTAELAAWTMTANALLNLDETVTRN